MSTKGYAIFDYDNTGMLEIQKLDEDTSFDTDEEAVQQAIKDGIKIIPVEELPKSFERRYLGWIDTPENREKIRIYSAVAAALKPSTVNALTPNHLDKFLSDMSEGELVIRVMEECGEFIQALSKVRRMFLREEPFAKEYIVNLAEETAHLMMGVQAVMYKYAITSSMINKEIDRKLQEYYGG